jgi:tetratricopeptide (TPR) repeat protein
MKESRTVLRQARSILWTALIIAPLLLVMAATPASGSDASEMLYAKGLVAFTSQRWDEAYRFFDDAARSDPNDAAALYYRGLVASKLGRTNEAIRDVGRAAEIQPDLPGAALDLGILYFDASDYEKAGQWLERAYEQPRNRFAAALFLGVLRFRLGDGEGATRFLTDAAKDPALRAAAHYYQALVHLRANETEEGRRLLEQVRDQYPETETGQVAAQYLLKRERAPGLEAEVRPWGVHVHGAFEYDSNVVLAPDDSDIASTRGISDEGDGRFVIGAGGRYRFIDADSLTATASYDFHQSVHFDLTEFDLQGHRVRADVMSRPRLFQYGFSGIYDFYALNYQTYSNEGRFIPWLSLFEGEVAATQVYYGFRVRDFLRRPFDPFLDDYRHAFGLRQHFLLGAVGRVLSVGYQFDDDDPISDDGNEFEHQGHEWDVAVAFKIEDWVDSTAGYLFRLEDYQFPNSRNPSGFRRHDREHGFIIQVARQITESLTVDLHYIGIVNDSNTEPFEYTRHVVSAGLWYRF